MSAAHARLTMAPRDSTIREALKASASSLFHKDRNALTVNAVRKLVEEKCGLDTGFLKSDTWKEKSKDIINKAVVCLAQTPDRRAPQGR